MELETPNGTLKVTPEAVTLEGGPRDIHVSLPAADVSYTRPTDPRDAGALVVDGVFIPVPDEHSLEIVAAVRGDNPPAEAPTMPAPDDSVILIPVTEDLHDEPVPLAEDQQPADDEPQPVESPYPTYHSLPE